MFYLEEKCNDNDIIVIHDGIRPLVDDTVLSDVIIKCQQYGNAVTSMPYNEQIFKVKSENTTSEYIPRETLRRVSTPQAYKFGKLDWAYHEAFKKGIGIYGSSYANTMMVDLGEKLHFLREGVRRKALYKDGVFWDIYEYGLLKEEWRDG